MKLETRIATALIIAAAFACGSARAQTYGAPHGQPPLYPYAVQSQQPYAIEVAPNTYVIQRPARARRHVVCVNCGRSSNYLPPEQSGAASDRPRQPADRGLIEELRKGKPVTQTVITTKQIVREKPIVKETTRVVVDPPRVIERRHVVDDAPAPAPRSQAAEIDATAALPNDGKARVIRAEAEVTILGPDRMSIRLFRKRPAEAKAQPGE